MGLPPVSSSGSSSSAPANPPVQTNGAGPEGEEQPVTVAGQQHSLAASTEQSARLQNIFPTNGSPEQPRPALPLVLYADTASGRAVQTTHSATQHGYRIEHSHDGTETVRYTRHHAHYSRHTHFTLQNSPQAQGEDLIVMVIEEGEDVREEEESKYGDQLTITKVSVTAMGETESEEVRIELGEPKVELAQSDSDCDSDSEAKGCDCGGACNCAETQPASPTPTPEPEPEPEPESSSTPPPPSPPPPAPPAPIDQPPLPFAQLRRRLPKLLCLRNLTGNLTIAFHTGRAGSPRPPTDVELNLRRSRDFRLMLLPPDVQAVVIRRPHGRAIDFRTEDDHLFEVSPRETHGHFVFSVSVLRQLYTEITHDYLQAIGAPPSSQLARNLRAAITGMTANNVRSCLLRIYSLLELSTDQRLWPRHNAEITPSDDE